MGPEHRRPSWKTGTTHSSLSSASFSSPFSATAPSKSDLESAVAGLLEIKRGNPEHERAIDCAVQLMTDQKFTIDFLSTALVDVRIELKELLVALGLNEEGSEAIKTMHPRHPGPPGRKRRGSKARRRRSFRFRFLLYFPLYFHFSGGNPDGAYEERR